MYGEGTFARLQSEEPALLAALATLVGGFVAQAGPGGINSMKALGTSVTVSGLQGILTRHRVFSPATVKAQSSVASSLKLQSVTPWLAQGAEPALAMSLVGLLAGFLLQVVGGSTDLLQALGISAGLAGTQGIITRQSVYSPRTVALDRLAQAAGRPSVIATLTAAAGGVSEAAVATATGTTAPPPLPTAPTTPAPRATRPIPPAAPIPTTPTTAARPSPTPPTRASPEAPPTNAGGATFPDPNVESGLTSLLQRWRPVITYDSLESFFADSAAILTDHPGNVLKRSDGTVIAATTPGAGIRQLRLTFLGVERYGDGQPAYATDYIEEVGGDYIEQAHQMHQLADCANRVHGRVAVDSSGARWLQYWFFMYYDNPNFLGFGTHQGDLEMIQLRLDASGQPDAASYSQHRSGVRASWDQLEHATTPDGPAPVTYSARGSHANLLRRGVSISTRSFVPDHNDGQGPRIRPELTVLSDTLAPWSLWPGSWGGTHASGILGVVGVAANSPTSPTLHLAWQDPAAFHASCELSDDLPEPGQPTEARSPAPTQPQLSVQKGPTSTTVNYTLPAGSSAQQIVAALVPKDGSSPAVTRTADIRGASGQVQLPVATDGGPYEVRATVHDASGRGSPTASVPMSS